MNTIITIGREFGSGGREFGRRLAEELGYEYIKPSISTVEVITTNNLIYQFYPFENDIIFYVVNANKNDISFRSKEIEAISKQMQEMKYEN